MPVDEPYGIFTTWAIGVLKADTEMATYIGGRAYDGQAPQLIVAAYPLAIVDLYTSSDVTRAVGSTEIWHEMDFIIKAVVKGESFAPARPIAARFRALFNESSGQTPDGLVLECNFRRTHRQIPPPDPQTGQYRELGGIWRARIQPF